MQRGQHEYRSLAHARLRLAEDVDTHHGLGYALLLHLTRMLEATVCDRLHQLWLQQEVLEACRVNSRKLQVIVSAQNNRGKSPLKICHLLSTYLVSST